MNLTKNNMEAMENEFIFTAAFAVVWLILSVAMLATALVLKFKHRTMGLKAYNKWSDLMYLSFFLWMLYGVAMIAAFSTELTIKLI